MECRCEALKASEDLSGENMETYSYEHLTFIEFDARSDCSVYECPKTKIVFLRHQEVSSSFQGGEIGWSVKEEDTGEE